MLRARSPGVEWQPRESYHENSIVRRSKTARSHQSLKECFVLPDARQASGNGLRRVRRVMIDLIENVPSTRPLQFYMNHGQKSFKGGHMGIL